MELRILGCAGGEGAGFRATSFLINQALLVDAGSVANSTSLEKQKTIEFVLITHPHLDHVKDLGFILDNTYGLRPQPLKVCATPGVIEALKQHYFNWVIWPDFSKLPSPENPILEFISIYQGIELNHLKINFYPVNHPGDSSGYLIEDLETNTSIVVTGDTSTTELIWKAAKECKNLKAIFVDTAFPDDMVSLAEASGHYTPSQLYQQLECFDLMNVPIYCYHLKPAFHERVAKDIRGLGNPNFIVLKDGEILEL